MGTLIGPKKRCPTYVQPIYSRCSHLVGTATWLQWLRRKRSKRRSGKNNKNLVHGSIAETQMQSSQRAIIIIHSFIAVVPVSRGWANASACLLHVSMSSAISCPSGILFRSPLSHSTVFPCRLSCHNNGLRVVTRDVRRSSSRRLMCAAQDHLIFLTLLINITSMTCDLSLTQMLVSLSFHLMLSILLSMLVCAASLFHGCWASRPLSILL